MDKQFLNGSQWVRFDCHLHTKEDIEFDKKSYTEFFSEYIAKLKENEIEVGVITNHNKFNRHEFKQLKKQYKNGYLLSGVELNIKEGANGIHTLIVFNEAWHTNKTNEDFINRFLNSVSEGQENFATKNGKTNTDLIATIKKLEDFKKNGRDYFIILAHVDNNSGFFKEISGGIIKHLKSEKLFFNNIIALQKSRQEKNYKSLYREIACVEGSDPKRIGEIGKGQKSYIKIGDYNFEAIKFSLQNGKYRVTKGEKPRIENSYIKSISFEGGKLNGQTIDLSSSMNNFIGIRGSGKSSVVEAIRYGLGIPFGENSADRNYKNNLVKELLGSAGKITIKVIDRDGREFYIERVFGHSIDIKKNGEAKKISISSILNKPLYFGQKDLSSYKDGYEGDLINKLIGNKLKDIQNKINLKRPEIKSLLENIKKYDDLDDKKELVARNIEELNLKIDEFKKHKVEEKLQKQIEFNKDKTNIKSIKNRLDEFKNDIKEFLSSYEKEEFFKHLKTYDSKENRKIFKEIYEIIDESEKKFIDTTKQFYGLIENIEKISETEEVFNTKLNELETEFIEIQRDINIPNLRADDFINYTKSLMTQKMMLSELEKGATKKEEMNRQLLLLLSELNELYIEEFKIIETEVKKINNKQKFVELKTKFKGDKKSFEKYLRDVFIGTGLTKADYKKLSSYMDCIEIYKDFEKISFGGNKLLAFKEKFTTYLSSLLTYQVLNKVEIFYNGKELMKHSLGQRSSALIIFILTQRDNDIIIIDQPEDDLDNQTIYNEVIKELVILKNKTQFIFATHNANIPVLGDCEQIVVCGYEENKINIELGSVDNQKIQNKIINIMEGGGEAFNKRREIYNLWNH